MCYEFVCTDSKTDIFHSSYKKNMKPTLSVVIKQHHSPASSPSNKAKAIVMRKRTNAKTELLDAAVPWYIQNGC